MKVFLPPSEGKSAPLHGPRLNLETLSFPELNPTRIDMIHALQDVSGQPDALNILGVGARVSDDVAAQTDLLNLPCASASDIYTGVLYTALDFAGLTSRQYGFAMSRVMIFSGLFGALTPTDVVPAYRLSMGTNLPTGNTSTIWRNALTQLTTGQSELIVDCRSSNYRIWNPRHSIVVTIRAERIKNGRRQVVSHNAKHYRGLLVGELLRAENDLDDPEELAEFAHVLIDRGFIHSVELEPKKKEWQLTLVEIDQDS